MMVKVHEKLNFNYDTKGFSFERQPVFKVDAPTFTLCK